MAEILVERKPDIPFKLPERQEGESGVEYAERLEWHRLRDEDRDRTVKGYVATPDGFVHWSKATHLDDPRTGIRRRNPRVVFERPIDASIFGPVAKPRRSTPAERVKRLTDDLVEGAMRAYKLTGRASLPRSVVNALVDELRRQGQHVSAADLETYSAEMIRRAMGVYAQRLLENAAKSDPKASPLMVAG